MSALRIEIVDYLKDYGFGRYAVSIDGAVKGFSAVPPVLDYVESALMEKSTTATTLNELTRKEV